MTTEELYQLLGWQHWYRSVSEAFTAQAATANAVLLQRMLSALLQQPGPGTTIFVGHDGNLDGLATLLDAHWDAPPYLGGALLPTPPGRGMLLTYNRDTDAINASFVYPVVNGRNSTLRDAPIKELQGMASAALLARVNTQLKAYPGASECFHKGAPGPNAR